MSSVDRSVSQGDGEHGLADAGRSDEQDVGGVVEETTGPSSRIMASSIGGLAVKSKSLMVQGAGKFANRILALWRRCSVASTSIARSASTNSVCPVLAARAASSWVGSASAAAPSFRYARWLRSC